MKYYGIFNCYSRNGPLKSRVTAEFPDDESPQIIMAIMAQIGYFGEKEEYLEIYNDYHNYVKATNDEKKIIRVEMKLNGNAEYLEELELDASLEDVQYYFLDEITLLNQCKDIKQLPETNAFYCIAEEWNGGIGLSKEAAMIACLKSDGDDLKWDE